ncbi:hypothetical protein ACFLQI_01345 [Candidatus Undinarchaeota archaeon]
MGGLAMFALDKKLLNNLGASFLLLFLLLKIVFFKESLFTILKVDFAFFWIFLLPGLPLTYLFKFPQFYQRLIIGSALGASLIGFSSYYLGLLGLNVLYSGILLPPIYAAITILVMKYLSQKD